MQAPLEIASRFRAPGRSFLSLGSGHPSVKCLYKDSILQQHLQQCEMSFGPGHTLCFCSGAGVPSGCYAHACLLQSRLSPSWTYTIALQRRNSKWKPKERNSSTLGLSCMSTSTALNASIHLSQTCSLEETVLRLLLQQRWQVFLSRE